MNRYIVIIITCLICFGYTEVRLEAKNKHYLDMLKGQVEFDLLQEEFNIQIVEGLFTVQQNIQAYECDLKDPELKSKECQEFNKQ